METLLNSFKRFSSVGNLAVVSSLLLLGFFLAIYTPKDYSIFSCPNPSVIGKDSGLAASLERASEGNTKTVILAVVNEAYVADNDEHIPAVNMIDLFLESFWVGEETRPLINQLVIVAADPTAYEKCVFRGLHCYLLPGSETDGADLAEEEVFESEGFINMMWARTLLLLNVLKEGYSFIYTDIDVMWLRNPLTRLITDETNDIKFSTDFFNGDPKSDLNPINTGFYHVRSNKKTISLFERWYAMHNNSSGKEQDVLQMLVHDGALRQLNLTVTFLDTQYFSGFCQGSDDPREVVTVHANCCRYIAAKVKDLATVLGDWKRFKRSEMNETALSSFGWSPHLNCKDSWHH